MLPLGAGLVVGILRLRRLPVIDWLLLAYIELFRCTPLLVQIIWFYYALPVVIGVNIPAHVAAVSVLSLYGGAFYAEIVRGSIESVHSEAGGRRRPFGVLREYAAGSCSVPNVRSSSARSDRVRLLPSRPRA